MLRSMPEPLPEWNHVPDFFLAQRLLDRPLLTGTAGVVHKHVYADGRRLVCQAS